MQLETLEDRLLYSAAPAPTPAPVSTEVVVVALVAPTTAESVPPPVPAAPDDLAATAAGSLLSAELGNMVSDPSIGSTLIVVDPSVPEFESLLELLTTRQSGPTEILVLDSQRDGLEQIADRLEQLGQTKAIHILSHGDEAGLHLGSNWLSADTISLRSNALSQWQGYLTPDADVLFYGCDLAANPSGQEFLRTFGQLTGADVAASTDATGAALLGGDWQLEFQFGTVETPSLGEQFRLFEWNGLLTTNTYQQGVSYSGTQDTSIRSTAPGTNSGSTGTVTVGGVASSTGLIRFDSLFGNGAGQIPLGSTIHSASLRLNVTSGTSLESTISLHRVLANWSESSTWNTLGSGLSRDDVEVATVADAVVSSTRSLGVQTISGLEQSLQAWSEGNANNGWALFGDNATEWTFTSSGGATVSLRPMLIVDYTASIAVGTQIAATNEVRVNTTTANSQTTATNSRSSHDAVGVDAYGNYVVVWTSDGQDGSGAGVYAQRFNARGVRLGTEFRINEQTLNGQYGASVAMKADGGFIVTWTSAGQDGSGTGVYARIFDALGSGASEFRINQTTVGIQQAPAIGVDSSTGDFVIAWEGSGTGDADGIFARRFRANGTTYGGEFRINTTTTDNQYDPAIAVGQDGQFMVVWDDAVGTHGRRFNSSGVALDAADQLLHSDITSGNADVATNGTGAYHIVWRTTGGGDGSGRALWKMELDAADTTAQPPEQVTTSTINSQTEPSITSDGNGDFLITWQGTGPGDTSGVFARKFRSEGIAQGAEFLLNATTAESQDFVSAAMVDLDNFVTVWSGNGTGDTQGVFARAYGQLQTGDSLLFTTWSNVTSSGAIELQSWTKEDIISLGEPNLTLGPNASGALSIVGNFGAFGDGSVKLESIDILQHDVLVGTGGSSMQLYAGDVLFSVSGSETLGSLTMQGDDVAVFRPDVPGSFASGSFFLLFDGLESIAGAAIDYLADIDLIEQATLVGDVLLQPGDLVVADIGTPATALHVFHATGVGSGTTTGTVTPLLIETEIHLDKEIVGIQVIERDTVIGGVQLREGNLLVAVNLDSTLGTNDLAVTLHDVVLLDVTKTSVNGPAEVTASMLILGSDVHLDSGAEAVRNLALFSVAGVPPAAQNETYTLTEDQVFHSASLWYDANWSSRMQLTFDNSSRAENLDDFPVLVTLDANRIDYALAQSDGGDLRFVDINGQLLSHEIETWNPNGVSTIWVKVPRIDASSASDSIWLYYGNNSAADVQNAAAVWSNGYVGVWHLNGDPSGTQAVQDSSASHVDGTSTGMDATNQINGPIGGALNFNGTNEFIRVATTASDPTAVDPTQLTIEAWANSTGDSGAWERIVNRRNIVVIIPFESYGLATSSSDPTQVVDSTGTPDLAGTSGSLPEDDWRYLTGTLSGSTSNLYIDGTLNATQSGVTSFGSSNDDITIGAGELGLTSTISQYWTGGIDEVRLSNVARSAAWTAAQYASMTDTLISYGERQTVAGLLDNDQSSTSGGLTVSAVDLSEVSGLATAVVLDDGQFTFAPGGSFQALAAGQTSTKQIDYTVMDDFGNTAQATATIIVQGVNDAPVINTGVGPLTLSSVLEDATNPPGNTVAAIIASAGGTLITDVDTGAQQGIAVTGVDNSHGHWEYSPDGSTWTSLVGASDTNATLLNTSAHVRFIPTTGYSGAGGILTFRAWDQSSGTNTQTGVNASVQGEGTAFSSQTTSASVIVTPLNDPPVMGTNTGLTVSEGGNGLLTSTRLSASDVDNTADQLVYTVSSLPTRGRLERVSAPGTAITTFTQADLNSSAVRYVHDGGETTSDGFGFSLSDGAATVTGSFAITVTPVNDAPVVSTQTGLTVLEGSSVVIPASKLSTTDADHGAGSLTYTVTGGLGFGHLALASAPGSSITTFTQAQINANQIVYVHGGAETAAEYFTFSVSDGALSVPGTLSLTVTPVNDLPDFAAYRLTISEGQTLTLTDYNLLTNDNDASATSLVYTVNAVTNGRFEFAATPGVVITSFTQDDINNSRVRFVHNGSETAPIANVSVTDGVANVGPKTMLMTFSNANDVPSMTTNTGLTLNEGASSVIGNAILQATDPDNAASQLVYTLSSAPAHGRIEKTTVPGVAISTFSQANLNSGIVRYVHDGGESVTDSLAFLLSDGTATVSGTLAITVTPVNDVPVVSTNTGVTVSEGGATVLGSAQLAASDPDQAAAQLLYTVNSAPANGRLELTTAPGISITSFSQATLNNGVVRYVQNGGETTSDSFGFSLSDGTASVAGSFAITIAPINDAPVLTVNSIPVNEGETVSLTSLQLNASDPDAETLTFMVSSLTQGEFRNSALGTTVTAFTNGQLQAGLITFVHDGGNTAPTGQITVSDGTLITAPVAIGFSFNPVNDPPVLTASTITVSEGQFVILSTANLNANDSDTSSLVFTVSGVTHGLFQEIATGSSVTAFTLAQIQDGQIKYVHDGSEFAPTAVVSVSDGAASTAPVAIGFVFSHTNDAPVLAPATFSVPENASTGLLLGQVVWIDPDGDDSHTFSILPGPSSSLFTIDALTGAISVADGSGLDYEVAASHDLQVQIADRAGTTSQATIQIDLLNVNEAPLALGFPPIDSPEDGPVMTIDLTTGFRDPESASLSFQIVAMTNPGLFSSAQITPSGVLELRGAADANGACTLTIRATDPFGMWASTTIDVVLTAVNDDPVAQADSWTTPIDSTVVIHSSELLANDADADHDPLIVSILRQPDHGTLVANGDGTFTFSPAVGYTGMDYFEYSVSDGTSVSDAAEVSLNITAVAPVVANSPSSSSTTTNTSPDTPVDDSGDASSTGTTSNATTSSSATGGSPDGLSGGGSSSGTHSTDQETALLAVMPKSQDEEGLGLFLNRQRPDADDAITRGRSPLGLDAAHRNSRSGGAHGTLPSAETNTALAHIDISMSPRLSQLRAILSSNANQSAFAEVTKSLHKDLTGELVFEVPALAGVSLTVGYVVWMLRGGLLISSLLAQMPMWSIVDPLTVLDSLDQTDPDDESIGSLVEQGQSELEPAL